MFCSLSNLTMIYHLIINQARDTVQLVHHILDLRMIFRSITNQTFRFSATGKSLFCVSVVGNITRMAIHTLIGIAPITMG